MSGTMRAAVLAGPREVRIDKVDVPEPGPGEVRVRLEGCGVCGSDLALWEGRDWFDYPREPGAPGHEAWGRVDAVGAHVTDVEVGTRVAGLFSRGYSEMDVARADQLVRVPDALGDRPFPGEAIACAINAFRRAQVHEGARVAVVGTGFLGALFVRLATHAGAHVVALSRRPYALKVAESMGARQVVPLRQGEGDPVQETQDHFDGALPDVVVEATGKQAPLDLAARLTRTRGRLVIMGYHQDGRRTVDMQLWNWRGLDVVNAHERDPRVYVRGIDEAARLASAGVVDTEALVTHTFPLNELPRAFRAMQERPDGFLKAVVRP